MGDENQRPMTLGERRVVLSFNPSKDQRVDDVKRKVAALIDDMEALKRDAAPGSEQGRWCSLAQTHFEDAAMYAVKAVTARY